MLEIQSRYPIKWIYIGRHGIRMQEKYQIEGNQLKSLECISINTLYLSLIYVLRMFLRILLHRLQALDFFILKSECTSLGF